MLELYQAEDCPYSAKVRTKLTELGLSVVMHNPRTHDGTITNAHTHEALTTIGGEDQIPFLVDTDREVTLYESDDIIEYLDTHYG